MRNTQVLSLMIGLLKMNFLIVVVKKKFLHQYQQLMQHAKFQLLFQLQCQQQHMQHVKFQLQYPLRYLQQFQYLLLFLFLLPILPKMKIVLVKKTKELNHLLNVPLKILLTGNIIQSMTVTGSTMRNLVQWNAFIKNVSGNLIPQTVHGIVRILSSLLAINPKIALLAVKTLRLYQHQSKNYQNNSSSTIQPYLTKLLSMLS